MYWTIQYRQQTLNKRILVLHCTGRSGARVNISVITGLSFGNFRIINTIIPLISVRVRSTTSLFGMHIRCALNGAEHYALCQVQYDISLISYQRRTSMYDYWPPPSLRSEIRRQSTLDGGIYVASAPISHCKNLTLPAFHPIDFLHDG